MKKLFSCLIPLTLLLSCARDPASDSTEGVGLLDVPVVAALDVPATRGTETLFYDVNDATRLTDGSIVVADGFGPWITVFDSGGKMKRHLGRRGAGPGEYSSPRWVEQCSPDTIFVWDRMLRRLTTFDASGRVVAQATISRGPNQLGCNRLGQMLWELSPTSMGTPSDKMLKGGTIIATVKGDSIGSLGEIPVGQNRTLGMLTVFVMTDSQVIIGTATSGQLDLYDFTGRRTGKVDLPVIVRRPTERNYAAAVTRLMDQVGRGPNDSFIRRKLLEPPMPDRLPAYRGLFSDPDDRIWVLISAPGDSSTELIGFIPGHAPKWKLRIPDDIDVFQVGRHFVLGRAVDAGDMPHLVLYTFDISGTKGEHPR